MPPLVSMLSRTRDGGIFEGLSGLSGLGPVTSKQNMFHVPRTSGSAHFHFFDFLMLFRSFHPDKDAKSSTDCTVILALGGED